MVMATRLTSCSTLRAGYKRATCALLTLPILLTRRVYSQETERDFLKNGLAPVICAHIADGNFHCCVPYQPKDLKEKSKVVELEHDLIR